MQLFTGIGAKRVGVVFDPSRTGGYLKRAQQAAEKAGIRLVTREVNDPREVVGAMAQMGGAVDALWMLPDTTAVTSATLEAYFGFSVKYQLPVVAFSEQYLSKGAAAALEIDRVDIGRQAGEMVNSLLKGADVIGVDPRKTRLSTNENLLRRLSKQIPVSDNFPN
jgi:putative ABC transport system substrate-binding protein